MVLKLCINYVPKILNIFINLEYRNIFFNSSIKLLKLFYCYSKN